MSFFTADILPAVKYLAFVTDDLGYNRDYTPGLVGHLPVQSAERLQAALILVRSDEALVVVLRD
jgi:hypothetical protein